MRKDGRGYYERPVLDESVGAFGILVVIMLFLCIMFTILKLAEALGVPIPLP